MPALPNLQSVISSLRCLSPCETTTWSGPKNGPVRPGMTAILNRSRYWFGERGVGFKRALALWSADSHLMTPVLADDAQSVPPHAIVVSIPSPGGSTFESASFTRSERPVSSSSAPSGEPLQSTSAPPLTAPTFRARRRTMSFVSRRSSAESSSSSQTRSPFASPPPPRTQLPLTQRSGSEPVSPLSHSASSVHGDATAVQRRNNGNTRSAPASLRIFPLPKVGVAYRRLGNA